MKHKYERPELTRYGSVEELTLGATGPKNDFRFINGQLITDTDAPTCQTNSTACVRFS